MAKVTRPALVHRPGGSREQHIDGFPDGVVRVEIVFSLIIQRDRKNSAWNSIGEGLHDNVCFLIISASPDFRLPVGFQNRRWCVMMTSKECLRDFPRGCAGNPGAAPASRRRRDRGRCSGRTAASQ